MIRSLIDEIRREAQLVVGIRQPLDAFERADATRGWSVGFRWRTVAMDLRSSLQVKPSPSGAMTAAA